MLLIMCYIFTTLNDFFWLRPWLPSRNNNLYRDGFTYYFSTWNNFVHLTNLIIRFARKICKTFVFISICLWLRPAYKYEPVTLDSLHSFVVVMGLAVIFHVVCYW